MLDYVDGKKSGEPHVRGPFDIINREARRRSRGISIMALWGAADQTLDDGGRRARGVSRRHFHLTESRGVF
jgi:hypothetical protein